MIRSKLMNFLDVKTEYQGIKVEATLRCGINVLYGDSAKGKSLLLKAIDQFCFDNDIKHRIFNYDDMWKACVGSKDRNLAAEQVKNNIKDFANKVDVLLLDNADTYLDTGIKELRQYFDLDNTIVVISMHSTAKLGRFTRVAVKFNGNELEAG